MSGVVYDGEAELALAGVAGLEIDHPNAEGFTGDDDAVTAAVRARDAAVYERPRRCRILGEGALLLLVIDVDEQIEFAGREAVVLEALGVVEEGGRAESGTGRGDADRAESADHLPS